MEIKFKLQATALQAALEIVGIVTPPAVTKEGTTGYLFVVRKNEHGEDCCYMYSRDAAQVARAHCKIYDVQGGEGAFSYPVNHIKGFNLLEGELEIEAKSEGDVHLVKHRYGNAGNGYTERSTFDPKLLSVFDKKLAEANKIRSYKVKILSDAIRVATPFMGNKDSRAKDEYKLLTFFDFVNEKSGKADGKMYATNGHLQLYYESDDFKSVEKDGNKEGKGMQIHAEHLTPLQQFLAKCEGEIEVRSTLDFNFAISSTGRVFGWANHEKADVPYKYYPRAWDKIILKVPKPLVVNQLEYLDTHMETGRDKIRVIYKNKTMVFQLLEGVKCLSFPIDTPPKDDSPEDHPFEYQVNLKYFLELFREARANDVELRIYPLDNAATPMPGQAAFRTIDEFGMDSEGKSTPGGIPCKITRCMTSKIS